MEQDEDGGWNSTDEIPGSNPQQSDNVQFLSGYTVTNIFGGTRRYDTNKNCYMLGAKTLSSVTIDSG